MSDDLGLSEQQAGYLSSAIFFTYLFGVGAMTIISGAVSPRRTLLGGLVASGGGFMLLSAAGTFWTLVPGFVLCGAGSAGIWLSVPTIATAVTPARQRGLVMGSMSASMGVGLVVSSQSIRAVRRTLGDPGIWRPIWIGCAAFTLMVLCLVALFMPGDTTTPTRNRLNLANLRLVPGWLPLTIAYVLHGLIVSNFSLYLGSKLELDGFSRDHVTSLFSLLGLAALGAIGLGRLSDRIGRRSVLLMAMFAMGVAAALVVVGREPFVGIAVVAFGCGSFAYPVVVTTLLRDFVSDRDFSNALGALTLIYGIALFGGPLIAGPIADSSLGFNVVYGGMVAVAAASNLSLLLVPRPARV